MGYGMAEVTEGDREKAREVVLSTKPEIYVDEYVIDGDLPPLHEAIAAALAEEREKARAPFLALAEAMERSGEKDESPSGDAAYFWARAIRNRVKETP